MQYSERYKVQSWVNLVDAVPLPVPLSISIEISGLCNFKCKFCMNSMVNLARHGKGHMSMDTFDLIIDNIREMNSRAGGGGVLKTLVIHGIGEAPLNPLFPEMLAKVDFSTICNSSTIVTNASLLKGKNAQAIINSNMDYIKISIYSVIQKRHEDITGSKIDINSIYENIAAFRKMRDESKTKKPYIYIKMIDTFTSENDVFLSMYNDIGDEVGIEQPFNWPGQNSIKAAYETAGNAEIVRDHYKHSLSSEKEVCDLPFFKLQITNNGDINACCQDPLDHLIMGNINNSSLYQIWNGYTFNKLRIDFLNRKMNLYEPCRHCEHYKLPIFVSNIDSVTSEEFINRLNKLVRRKV